MIALTQSDEQSSPDRDVFGRAPVKTQDWSHRRGEPRIFAFGWTLYLMAIVGLMFAQGGALTTFSAESFRPTARVTMVLLLVGGLVLWPLVRLSQARPRAGGSASTIRDLVVILVPAQALIWPQTWLADWPIAIVMMLGALFFVWVLLIGGIVAIGLGPSEARASLSAFQQEGRPLARRTRSWSLIACLVVGLAGLSAPAILDANQTGWLRAQPGWMASPYLSVFEITRDRAWLGSGAAVGRIHWLWVSAVGLLGATVWLSALIINALRARGAEPV